MAGATPVAMLIDGNDKPIQSPGWDATGHQFAQQQIFNAQSDSQSSIPYGPGLVSNILGTPVTASNTGSAAAAVAASLPAATGKTTYITGFAVTSTNPAATVSGVVTVTGTISGTLSYQFVESATLGGELIVTFPTPIPASAANQAIAVNLPTITSGGSGAVAAYGFQL